MSLLDRAAQAAAEEYGEDWEALPDHNPVANGESDRQQYRDMVLAVLQAIRTPTYEVIKAGRLGIDAVEGDCATDEGTVGGWQAMIDAALAGS